MSVDKFKRHKVTEELWAVMYPGRKVLYTHGGSSTSPRIMVYATQGAAEGQRQRTRDADAYVERLI